MSGVVEAMGLILELCPPGTIDDLRSPLLGDTPLQSSIRFSAWDEVKLILALGANPHHIPPNSQIGHRAQSSLALAMYSEWAFWSFRDALRGMNLDFEEFACQELEPGYSLLDDGWQMETLTALLKTDFKPHPETPKPFKSEVVTCDRCDGLLLVELQPYWQGILESIKNGTYPQNLGSGIQDVQLLHSSSSQSHLSICTKLCLTSSSDGSAFSIHPVLPEDQAAHSGKECSTRGNDTPSIVVDRIEIWCTLCWYQFKYTGRLYKPKTTETRSSDRVDLSGDDDFSPFLFNT